MLPWTAPLVRRLKLTLALSLAITLGAMGGCTTRFGAAIVDDDGGNGGDGGGEVDGGDNVLCGNGELDPGEECDGDELGGATCTSVSEGYGAGTLSCLDTCRWDTSGCIPKGCGDGVLDFGEECDDGNAENDDGCLNNCKTAFCGDGFVWDGVEECDDENSVDGDACTNACREAVCGDGVIWYGVEECDDGNSVDGDACTNACKNAICGDGILWEGVETCDGTVLADQSCEGLGFLQGSLGCTAECDWDTSSCIQCGDCKSCTKTKCFRDIYWWTDADCTIPYGSCTPCSHWGPANSSHSDGSFFCYENGSNSPYWNGGPCDWVDVEYTDDCDECGSWQCP